MRVLCGLAGSGKSAVALEVAHRAAAAGADVWWVAGAAEHTVAAGMLAVARRLGVPAEALHHGDAADQVWRALAARGGPWLLVFDGVDRPEVLAGSGALADGTGWLRPVAGGGLVLVTSRDGDPQTWGAWCVLDPVGMLGPADATRVLTDLAGEAGSQRAARALAERLGGLPLALRMCGAYLADTAEVPWPEPGAVTTFEGYLAALDAAPPGAAGSPAEAHRQIIARAWELSLDLLDERGLEPARPLLRVLSHLADAPVPYQLMLSPSVLATAAEFAGLTASRLWRVLRGLAALGLVDLADDAVAVHPLVRQASREPSAGLAPLAAELLVRAVAGGAIGPPHDPAAWPRWQAVAAHALHLAATLPDGPAADAEGVLACAVAAVRHLRARGMFEPAGPELRRLLGVAGRVLPAGHPLLAQLRHELGYTLYYTGRLADAEREFQAALAARLEVLGPAHPDTLQSQHALGRAARSLGRYAEAEARLRSVYEAQRGLLGPDHPDTLTSQHQLARALMSLGALQQSRAEFQRVLWRRRRTLGPLHPDTLMTRHQLAAVAYRQGRYGAAERQGRSVGELRRAMLGEHHPDTLHSRQWVALALAAQGHGAVAETELRDLLDIRRRVFGPRHPDTMTTHFHVAGLLAALGHTTQAAEEYRQVLAGRRQQLGDDHPDTRLAGTRLREIAGGGAP
ncbi:tetratricopeptide repeat protein [Dactylosporangium sp. CA-233914]|uniref:tetratricopeptide repeat protein n=1 Tax=Dactylosporangium sp. CA-233914 TaxID=3239934 RepID=UPI003D8C3958